jgi:hypothetical protein
VSIALAPSALVMCDDGSAGIAADLVVRSAIPVFGLHVLHLRLLEVE